MTNLGNLRNALQTFDFNTVTPYAVGFDRQFGRLMDYASHQVESSGFPPYNIIKDGDYNFTIEMALAGYSKKDIDVEVAEGVLTIKSIKESKLDDVDKIYRGIANRNFTRKFTLADDIVVKGGSLTDGMLKLELERVIPEEKKPRQIDIK